MYNNPYVTNYNPNFSQQSLSDKIDAQISQLNQMKEQIKANPQQPAINQTFQLAPNNHGIRFVNNIEDVGKENVYVETPFFSNDMSILWIKSPKGNIKTYELTEIIPKDEKDIQIELLQEQINELRRGMSKYEFSKNDGNDVSTKNATDTTKYDEEFRTEIKNDKSTSVQKVSRGKAK